jgi:2-polyprenyl-3-methyl-5-hydroxy-6-metoxy-1,4-benzoquinol methylase
VKDINKKRKDRKKLTAEDFTPEFLVIQILDKLNEYSPESWEEGKSFLDPACGNGNMLVCVLKRKLDLGHNPLASIRSVYGTDIMEDNIQECRQRLLDTLAEHSIDITEDYITAVNSNIIYTPLDKYPRGSLDYNF